MDRLSELWQCNIFKLIWIAWCDHQPVSFLDFLLLEGFDYTNEVEAKFRAISLYLCYSVYNTARHSSGKLDSDQIFDIAYARYLDLSMHSPQLYPDVGTLGQLKEKAFFY